MLFRSRMTTCGFRTRLVAPVLAWAGERGCDPAALCAGAGLPVPHDPAAELSVELARLRRLFAAVADATGDAGFGIAASRRIPRHHWPMVDYPCANAPTVGEALDRLARYFPLINDHVVVAVDRTGYGCRLDMSIPGEPLALGQHGNELWLCMVIERVRASAGRKVLPRTCWLAHPAPPRGDAIARLAAALGTDRLEFGRERNGFELGPDMDEPVADADPMLLELLDRHARRELAERGPGRGVVARIAQLVRHALPEPPPSIQAAARRLRMSPRTLQRQLADAGTSYRQVVDGVREQVAEFHVAAGRSVDEIAFELGYSERAAFLRAFQRWHGTTPTRLRRWRALSRPVARPVTRAATSRP